MKLEEIENLCETAVNCCDELEVRRLFMPKLVKFALSMKTLVELEKPITTRVLQSCLDELESDQKDG